MDFSNIKIRKIVFLAVVFIFSFAISNSVKADENDTIINGVSIGSVDIGGLTRDEAIARVQEYMSTFTEKRVTFKVDQNTVDATIGELGYYWKNESVVDDAKDLCKKGNIIERYKEKKDVQTTGINYELELDVNNNVMRETLDKYCSQYNMPHVNASITKTGDGFSYSEESAGRIIDVDTTVNEFHQFLLNSWDGNDAELTVTMMDDMPTATIEDCQKVKDVLGTFSTTFSTGSGNYNRNCNIENGSRLMNGIVLYPGDVFSANALLEPWTYDNGWREAGTYVNGQVENSLGGGICQVSTTLYNAVLEAELEIVERYPHSMSVGYVPLSQDAALAGTYKDLKFSNNTDAPIYIESYCGSGRITFNIYGHETRDPNRTIEFVSETLSTVHPSESIQEDPNQPPEYREVVSNGHVGYTAQLWKKVYENGKLVSEDVINKSVYEASPSKVIVGTGTAEPTTPEGETQEGESKPGETQEGESKPEETKEGETKKEQGEEETTKKEKKDKPEETKPEESKKEDDNKKQGSDDKKNQDSENNEENNE